MSNILTEIIRQKKAEVERRKEEKKISDFEASPFFNRIGKSLKKTLSKCEKPSIIAEFKRKNVYNNDEGNLDLNVQSAVRDYVAKGAIGISVVTEKNHFKGKLADLKMARQVTESPLIRQDFIFDEFQVYEAKANGADVIVLIAEILDEEQILNLTKVAKEIGLEVMFEVNSAQQLTQLNQYIDIVCVNNLNRATSTIDIQTAHLIKEIPTTFEKIVTGVQHNEDLKTLHQLGYKTILVDLNEISNKKEEFTEEE